MDERQNLPPHRSSVAQGVVGPVGERGAQYDYDLRDSGAGDDVGGVGKDVQRATVQGRTLLCTTHTHTHTATLIIDPQ